MPFPAEWPCRQTLRRRLNLHLNRLEHRRMRTRLRSRPWILSLEPTNACNLRCPFCFTGAGGLGRTRSSLSLALYRRLLAELGDYLVLLKAYGWGEPLLCGHLETMVAEASARGICVVVNTNLSVSLDRERAEALVASGLHQLVVSVDGARQETYERYRVGGRLALVRDNLRLIEWAKQRLGASTPGVVVEFHPFPWSVADASAMHDVAAAHGASLRVFKGCVPGEEWGMEGPWAYCATPTPMPCAFLWTTAVVAADGGVQPCNGTFYAEDDMGRIRPDALAARPFHAVWNNERFQLARRFFRHPGRATTAEREHVCFECPSTTLWARYLGHRFLGGAADTFPVDVTTNDAWNYFWNRRPAGAVKPHAGGRRACGG